MRKKISNKFKKVGKQIAEELIEQGKTIAVTAVSKFVDQGKDVVLNVANKKISELSGGNTRKDELSDLEESFEYFEIESESEFSEETYQDGDHFEENIRSNLTGVVTSLAAGNPAEATEALTHLVTMAGEVAKFTEVQKTKRKEIEAKRDIIVSNIQSQKEIILAYLDKSFDERKENFAKLFEVVDNAMESNNLKQLAMGLDSINKLATSSPFKELANIETTRKALEDKNHVWDF